MVLHAESHAGIELHYATQLTVQSARGFGNAAESTLPAVDEPPTDVPFLSSLPLLLCCCARSFPNHHHLSAGKSIVVYAHLSLALHKQVMPHSQEICLQLLHSCRLSVTHIYTYIQTQSLHAIRLVASLPAWPLHHPYMLVLTSLLSQ